MSKSTKKIFIEKTHFSFRCWHWVAMYTSEPDTATNVLLLYVSAIALLLQKRADRINKKEYTFEVLQKREKNRIRIAYYSFWSHITSNFCNSPKSMTYVKKKQLLVHWARPIAYKLWTCYHILSLERTLGGNWLTPMDAMWWNDND